jgi:hypothetical protein
MIPRLNPLLAFVAATVSSTAWMSAFLFFSDSTYIQSVSSMWVHFGFVWVPVMFTMCIQAYSSISLKMSLLRGSLLSFSSAILAPMIGASILMFVGFIWFGWQM